MTYETCLKQAENCRENNDEAGAKMYEDRAARKMKKLNISIPKEEVEEEAKSKEKKK